MFSNQGPDPAGLVTTDGMWTASEEGWTDMKISVCAGGLRLVPNPSEVRPSDSQEARPVEATGGVLTTAAAATGSIKGGAQLRTSQRGQGTVVSWTLRTALKLRPSDLFLPFQVWFNG